MKKCLHCGSVTFDDMDTCYECMQPFSENPTHNLNATVGDYCLHVTINDDQYEQREYDILVPADGGAQISIGNATVELCAPKL